MDCHTANELEEVGDILISSCRETKLGSITMTLSLIGKHNNSGGDRIVERGCLAVHHLDLVISTTLTPLQSQIPNSICTVSAMAAFLSPPPLLHPARSPHSRLCVSAKKPILASLSPTTDLGPLTGVSRLAVGTWSWGNRILFDYEPAQDDNLQKTFEAAVARGACIFDTADSYGTGTLNARAEILLGRFLRETLVDTSNILIATKYASYPWRLTRRSIVDAAARSAERLGRPADIGQMHWSASRYAPWQERALWDGLADAMEAGYCRYIGLSNVGPRHLEKVHRYLRDERGVQIATVQTQLSLLSQQPTKPGGLFEVARELSIGLIGYSPLCLGLLSGRYGPGNYPKGLRGALFASLQVDNLISALRQVGEPRGLSPAQVAIAWCAAQGVVVLAGARSPSDVEDNISASTVELSDDDILYLESVAGRCNQMVQNAFLTS